MLLTFFYFASFFLPSLRSSFLSDFCEPLNGDIPFCILLLELIHSAFLPSFLHSYLSFVLPFFLPSYSLPHTVTTSPFTLYSLLLSHLLLARRSLYFPLKIRCTLCVLGNWLTDIRVRVLLFLLFSFSSSPLFSSRLCSAPRSSTLNYSIPDIVLIAENK